MAGHDYRSRPVDTERLSFYVFDNLRCQQDHQGGDIYRYDTVQEAVAAFQVLANEHPDWTIALGGSFQGTREIDFVQRRNGDNCLITDCQQIDFWKDRPDVQQAIETAMVGLKVEWQVDHELTGDSVLVPQEFDEPPLDRYFEDKELRPVNPDNALTSVQEVFADGEGWMSLQELRERTKSIGYESPDYPKVTRLNVAYRVPGRQRTGYVDASPRDFRLMKAAYLERAQEKDTSRFEKSVDDLAKQAKERAAQKNLERPERAHGKTQSVER